MKKIAMSFVFVCALAVASFAQTTPNKSTTSSKPKTTVTKTSTTSNTAVKSNNNTGSNSGTNQKTPAVTPKHKHHKAKTKHKTASK